MRASPSCRLSAAPTNSPIVRTADYATIDDAIRPGIVETTTSGRTRRCSPSPVRSTATRSRSPIAPGWSSRAACAPRQAFRKSSCSMISRRRRWPSWRSARSIWKRSARRAGTRRRRVVLGPGTGLGVAGLIRACGRWIPVPGEGGHMDIGPRTPRDFQVFPHLEAIEGRISGEQILCGRGLVKCTAPSPGPTASSRASRCPPRSPARRLPHRRGGRRGAGALRHLPGADGRRPGSGLQEPRRRVPDRRHRPKDRAGAASAANFRASFEDKAPHSALMRSMPVYVITHPLAALAGLAAYARQPDAFGVETRGRRWSSQ